MILEYKCKECGAVFYGWGGGNICPLIGAAKWN